MLFGMGIVLSFIILLRYFGNKREQIALRKVQQLTEAAAFVLPSPIVQREVLGVETIWQSPISPKAVLILFHGCTHDAADWFLLPEDSQVRK